MLLGGGFLTVLFFVGCFYLIRGGYRAKGPIFLWILVPLVVFSCVAEKDGRYLLPVLPAVALVSAMAIVGLRDAFFKTATVRRVIFLMAIFLIFMLGMWTTKDMYSHHLYRHYSGFQEAGDLVRQRARPGDLVLAGSVRAMRFTTDITLKEYG
jgi:4-amino-4-deoxy-L-arabinose transferase-like glycosyltransferase